MLIRPFHLSLIANLSLVLMHHISWAGNETGPYLGGGIGYISLQESYGTGKFDDGDPNGRKVFFGYNLGLVPSLYMAIEGGFVNFGDPRASVHNGPFSGNSNVHYEIHGYNGSALVGVSIGSVDLFAKIGRIKWDSNVTIDSSTTAEDGVDSAFGVGLQWSIFLVRARIEYEEYSVSTIDNLSLTSANLIYVF